MSKDLDRKIAKARVALLFDCPFFGHLSLHLQIVQDDHMRMPTIATDGTHLFYDSKWVNSKSLEELKGFVAHEVAHCALRHLGRRGLREPIRWNIAADLVTNALLAQDTDSRGSRLFDAMLKSDVLLDPAFMNTSVEEAYSRIKVTQVNMGRGGNADSHDQWEDYGKSEAKGKDGEEDGKGSLGNPGVELDEIWRERVAQAATQARMAGKLPGHYSLLVEDLLQPQLDWKTILRDTITSTAKSDFRIYPPNRKHIWRGIYLPSITGESIEIAVGIDVSGSVSDQEIRNALSEVKGICETYASHTIYLRTFDAKITGSWDLHEFDDMPTTVSGRGGTDFHPFFEDIKDLQFSTAVVLTDMYPNNGWPKDPGYPVIWIATTDVEPPYGITIRMPSE